MEVDLEAGSELAGGMSGEESEVADLEEACDVEAYEVEACDVEACEEEACESVEAFLGREGMTHLTALLVPSHTLGSLLALACTSRSELLQELRRLGVPKIGERQKLACALSRKVVTSSASEPHVALKELGNQRLAAGEVDQAIKAYEQALEAARIHAPDLAEVAAACRCNLSLALLRAGRHCDAEREAAEGIALQPGGPKAHYRLGSALLAQGRHEEAALCFRAAGTLTPRDAPERISVSRALELCERRRWVGCPGCWYNVAGRGTHCCGRCAVAPGEHDDGCERQSGAGPPRAVVPLDAPRVAAGGGRVRTQLLEHGYAVVAGAAGEEALRELRALMWSFLEDHGLRRDDPRSWHRAPPGPAHLGLVTWSYAGQSAFMWRARSEPRVIAAFEDAWGLPAGGGMLTSFDGFIFFRPPQIEPSWATRPALDWLHVDQGSTKRGLAGVQGALLLWDQTAESGGLVLLPRSHERHCTLVPEGRRHDYVQFRPDDPRLAGLGDARLVRAKAGDLVLWDSRTVHASAPADPAAPLPLDEDGRPRPSRAAALVSMVPAARHLAADPELARRREALVASSSTTTHWPQDTSPKATVSCGPPGSGAGSVGLLSAEARALVRGERRA